MVSTEIWEWCIELWLPYRQIVPISECLLLPQKLREALWLREPKIALPILLGKNLNEYINIFRAEDAQRVGNMGSSYFLSPWPLRRPLSNKQTNINIWGLAIELHSLVPMTFSVSIYFINAEMPLSHLLLSYLQSQLALYSRVMNEKNSAQ